MKIHKIYLHSNLKNLQWIFVDEDGVIIKCSSKKSCYEHNAVGFNAIVNRFEAGGCVCIYSYTASSNYHEMIDIKSVESFEVKKTKSIITAIRSANKEQIRHEEAKYNKGGKKPRININKLKKAVIDNPSATQAELATQLKTYPATINRLLKEHNIPYEKKLRRKKQAG